MRTMNSYEFLLKASNEQLGYGAQPPTSVTTRPGGPGAPALPPAPSATPVTMAPPPSPKTAGLGDEVQRAWRLRKLLRAAQDTGQASANTLGGRYRTARNGALKSLGLHGLGVGLGGLGLYGAGRYALRPRPSAEDFSASYGE